MWLSFPGKISTQATLVPLHQYPVFQNAWQEMMQQECHAHPIWQSPFIHAVQKSASDPDTAFELAATWSVNMIMGSYCFPRYVAALAARSETDFLRHGLLANAWDESGGTHHVSRSHFWLAIKLAHMLGLMEEEIKKVRPIPEAIAYTDEHFRICNTGNFEEGLGMICLIEEFTTPEFSLIFKAFLNSCQEALRISPEDFVLRGGGEYFTANISDDERHREEMPELTLNLLIGQGIDIESPDNIQEALANIRLGVQRSIRLREKFFHGIYRFIENGHSWKELTANT